MLIEASTLLPLLHCPRCDNAISHADGLWACSNQACAYRQGFPDVSGQPVLIDFDQSIFDPASYAHRGGSVLPRDDAGTNFNTRVRALMFGKNDVAGRFCSEMIVLAKQMTPRPKILVIGGGTVGFGTEAFLTNEDVDLVGTDVYASQNTCMVVDAHRLPFASMSFDAVWIQAVLEHVLDPPQAVSEIHRVLKPNGLLYADTPFMQHVHEGAYDFTRFTLSGHRWLLRNFAEIEAGTSGGAGRTLLWSIRYFVRAFGVGRWGITAAVLPFFWIRFLERFMQRGPNADAASGTFFFGRKAELALTPRAMVDYYTSKV